MIRCYMGLLGSGKTYSMVEDAAKHMKKHRQPVFSNMAGLKFPQAVYYANVDGLLDLRSGLVLFDEVGVALNSRFWQDVSRDIISRFSQARKHGLDLYYTAQYRDQADRTLKDVTNEFIQCRKLLGKLRRHTVLPGQTDKEASKNFWTVSGYRAEIFAAYDTLEVIATNGGSSGRADFAAPVPDFARKRSEEQSRGGAQSGPPPPPLTFELFGETRPTIAARETTAWLKERGRLQCQAPVQDVVMEELIRRRWLALFGLTWQDVPDDCTPHNPWLRGYDPASVVAREEAKSLKQDAEKLAERLINRSRPKNGNGAALASR